MEIRPFTLDDYDALAALELEVQAIHVDGAPHIFIPNGVTSPEGYQALLESPNHVVVLGIEDGAAVGYLHYEISERPASDYTYAQKVLHIHAISVKADQRRKGYGEALMEYAYQAAREQGASRVTLDVWTFNEDARWFYERIGFAPMQTRMSRPVI